MADSHHQRLYAVLRGPEHAADDRTEAILDLQAAEDLELIRPIILEIEAQAEARTRLQCLLELACTLKQATNLFAEVVR